MDPCREKGGVPPGAGGVASLTIAKLNFTRGSPGRGWGGDVLVVSSASFIRFPRARVGWRHPWQARGGGRGVPPGAGGVASVFSSVAETSRGSPGRGGGGACAGANATDCARFPRARVGWRVIPV